MALPTYLHLGAIKQQAGEPAAATLLWDKARAQYNTTVYGTNRSGAPAFALWSAPHALFYRDDSFLAATTPAGARPPSGQEPLGPEPCLPALPLYALVLY